MDSIKASDGKGVAESSLREGAKWMSDWQYLLACIGAAVGLGNLLRFPNLAYEYGGFGFLLPYVFAVVVIGVPLLGAECMFGQMTQRSAIKAFPTIRPWLWGLGLYVTWGALMVVSYYNVIMAWSLEYLFYSFQSPLPWGDTTASAEEFFFGTVLQMSKGGNGTESVELYDLHDGVGPLNWPLLLALAVQWGLIFACLFKLTKTVQYVVMVTVPLPFLIIIVMAIYGLTKEGAIDGVVAYIDPTSNPGALLSLDAWVDACGQIFFGLSLSVGVMLAYSSHQPKSSKVVRNTWIIALGNSFTSIFAGFAVFAVLGHFAFLQEASVETVASSGFVLSFQTFPATFSTFDGKGAPQAFSVMFFLTLILLGIDSAMSLTEAVCDALVDSNAWSRRNVPIVVGAFCFIGFLCSFVMATRGGYWVLDIIDHFTNNYLLLLGGFLTSITLGWLHPADRLIREVRKATGEDAFWLPFLWTYMIKFVTPTVLILLWGYNFVKDCMRPYGGHPQWALVIFGWLPCFVFPALAFGVPVWFFEKPSDIKRKLTGEPIPVREKKARNEADSTDAIDSVRSKSSVVTVESVKSVNQAV